MPKSIAISFVQNNLAVLQSCSIDRTQAINKPQCVRKITQFRPVVLRMLLNIHRPRRINAPLKPLTCFRNVIFLIVLSSIFLWWSLSIQTMDVDRAYEGPEGTALCCVIAISNSPSTFIKMSPFNRRQQLLPKLPRGDSLFSISQLPWLATISEKENLAPFMKLSQSAIIFYRDKREMELHPTIRPSSLHHVRRTASPDCGLG
jgi:hypothetical protein